MLTTHIHSKSKRLAGIVVLAGLCVALVAPAAQARPVGLVPNGNSGWTNVQTTAQAPPVRGITTTQDSGFSWADAAIGAAAAAGVLILARVAVSRPRPRLTA